MPRYSNFNEFIGDQSAEVAEICIFLDDLFLSYPGVQSKIRYNIPFYDYATWICYINPLRGKGAVELVFLNGKKLQQVFPFLEDKERKRVAGITIIDIHDEDIIGRSISVWEDALSAYQ